MKYSKIITEKDVEILYEACALMGIDTEGKDHYELQLECCNTITQQSQKQSADLLEMLNKAVETNRRLIEIIERHKEELNEKDHQYMLLVDQLLDQYPFNLLDFGGMNKN